MKNLRKMFGFMDGYKKYYILAIVSIFISQLILTISPLIIQTTIDSILSNGEISSNRMESIILRLGGVDYLRENLYIVGLIIVSVAIVRGLFLFLKSRFAHEASESTSKAIRDRLYDHIQRLPYQYHVNSDTGDLLQRATSDVDTIRRFLAVQALEFVGGIFMLVFVLISMFKLNTKMALGSVVIMPLIFLFALIFFKKIKSVFTDVEEAEAKMTTSLQENLTGVRVVKAFSNQNHEIGKFDQLNKNYSDQLYRVTGYFSTYWSVSDFLCFLQIVFVIGLGAYLSYKGEISMGIYAAFISYISLLIWPVRQMGRNVTEMGKAFVSLNRIEEILVEEIEVLEENKERPEIKGQIEFKDVDFSYEEGQKVLRGISFEVEAGETLAIVGPTGAGKTSLVHLIARLYEYDSGSIKVDGIELKDIDKSWIRNNVGLVLQEPFLYGKSIKENIRFQDPTSSDRKVMDAASIASIHDDILEFKEEYETLVGERGTSLSGGQKQRMAIARTIIKERPIVIFDDSLSAVDTETDISIRRSLAERKERGTTIIISHRISTASEADKIIVLNKGEIIEIGNHRELMAEDGLYKRIYDLQNKID